MLLVTYIIQNIITGTSQMDYSTFETWGELYRWLTGYDGELIFSLNKQNYTLTSEGWEKMNVSPANLIQVRVDSPEKMFITVDKIVSDDGIIFENIKHCSETIIDLMSLKYEFKNIN